MALKWFWPTNVTRISGYRYTSTHRAIDIGTPSGSPIYAAVDGVVTVAKGSGYNAGYGSYISITSSDGKYKVITAHLSKVNVRSGQRVRVGQQIGKSGNTGNSTGPHLHFEIRKTGGGYVNPNSIYGGSPKPGKYYTIGGLEAGPQEPRPGSVISRGVTAEGLIDFSSFWTPITDFFGSINWVNVGVVVGGVLVAVIGLTGLVRGEAANIGSEILGGGG